MTTNRPPSTIPELWYILDKRLALIEAAQAVHVVSHSLTHIEIEKKFDDHEQRLRTGMTFTGIMTGAGSLLALVAIIKSFFLP